MIENMPEMNIFARYLINCDIKLMPQKNDDEYVFFRV